MAFACRVSFNSYCLTWEKKTKQNVNKILKYDATFSTYFYAIDHYVGARALLWLEKFNLLTFAIWNEPTAEVKAIKNVKDQVTDGYLQKAAAEFFFQPPTKRAFEPKAQPSRRRRIS